MLGSDEYVLREILNDVDHIEDLFNAIIQCRVEMEYANKLKEFELGIIDADEINDFRNKIILYRQNRSK